MAFFALIIKNSTIIKNGSFKSIIFLCLLSMIGFFIYNLILPFGDTKKYSLDKMIINCLYPYSLTSTAGDLINSTKSVTVCVPVMNIVFIKTHKCGSSTVQNILFRFGDTNNLTFALPKRDNYFGHPYRFNRLMVPSLQYLKLKHNKMYNIFSHHTRFNYHEIKKIMPADSVYITILRDPVFLFESLYHYYDLKYIYGGLSFNNFSKHLLLNDKKINLNKRLYGKYGRNQMSFDLGLDSHYFNDDIFIRSFIKKLDSYFNLVMITERMDESLILLKDLLCWPTENVIVFKHNARFRSKNDKNVYSINESVRTQFQLLNRADQLLYDHFYYKFEMQIKKFGRQRMKQEMESLRNITKIVYNNCVEREMLLADLIPKQYHFPSVKVLGIKPKNTTKPLCITLTTPELVYTDILRQKQTTLFPPGWFTTRGVH